jgi:hypothetical protein
VRCDLPVKSLGRHPDLSPIADSAANHLKANEPHFGDLQCARRRASTPGQVELVPETVPQDSVSHEMPENYSRALAGFRVLIQPDFMSSLSVNGTWKYSPPERLGGRTQA